MVVTHKKLRKICISYCAVTHTHNFIHQRMADTKYTNINNQREFNTAITPISFSCDHQNSKQ